jgi:hypothetical protein
VPWRGRTPTAPIKSRRRTWWPSASTSIPVVFVFCTKQTNFRLLLRACNGRTEHRTLKVWVWRAICREKWITWYFFCFAIIVPTTMRCVWSYLQVLANLLYTAFHARSLIHESAWMKLILLYVIKRDVRRTGCFSLLSQIDSLVLIALFVQPAGFFSDVI